MKKQLAKKSKCSFLVRKYFQMHFYEMINSLNYRRYFFFTFQMRTAIKTDIAGE